MQVDVAFGREHLALEVPEGRLVAVRRQTVATPLADRAGAVRAALEAPLGFPPLRRALTPDDHVAIVLDEHLPQLAELLTPILEHIVAARVAPEAITLICAPSASRQEWLEDLPDEFQEARLEIHDPHDRKQLCYLATTRHGRRLYLNRTAVDADQLVVLSRRGYDLQLGYSGAAGALYPALSDETTRQELCDHLSLTVPGGTPWPLHQEAAEVAWLLGAPFFIQVIEGSADDLVHVIAGLHDSSDEGERLLDEHWRRTVSRPADTVVASVSGSPANHGFDDLARALACAARVVRPHGRIILLSRAQSALGAGAELLRQAGEPERAIHLLREKMPTDMSAAFTWASAAQQADIFLLSGLPAETVEELFATPLEHPGQVQLLLRGEGSCLVLNDAHRALAVVDEGTNG